MIASLLLMTSLAWAEPVEDTVSPPDTYDNGLIGLTAVFAARHGCACLFVMERDEDFCRAWIKVDPDVAKIRIDHENKKVNARTFLFWRASARWINEEEGCLLEQ